MGHKSIITTISINVAESFVDKENKRVGAGSGETRLYLGAQRNPGVEAFIEFSDAYTTSANNKKYSTCTAPWIVTKDNFIEYHKRMKDLYFSDDFANTNGKISSLYSERENEIKNLNEINRFEVFNQNGTTDSARTYIGSISKHWDLLRRIALPKYTCIRIDKLVDEDTDELSYVLSLHRKDDVDELSHDWSSHNYYEDVEDKAEAAIKDNMRLSDTEKAELVLARKGQGKFRKQVLRLMKYCPFTGISEPCLLRASHCMPWSECDTASDRLDGYNGLALTPTYDVLFDQGYISFTEDGKLLVSKCLGETEIEKLGLIENKTYLTEEMHLSMRTRFLDYHRKYVFRGGYSDR